MPRATTPATVAATAATAGTVRVRCRAASRTAYRITSGSRPPTLPRVASTSGISRIMPSTAGMAPPAMMNSPPPVAPKTEHGDADAEQHQAEQRGLQGRRPVAAAAGEDRDDVLPGGDVRRHQRGQERAEQAEARDPGQVQPRHVERAEVGPGPRLHDRHQEPGQTDPDHHADDRGDAAEHEGAADDDAARLHGRATRGRHESEAALLLSRADRERRTGEQDDLDQGHHHDQHQDRHGRLVGAAVVLDLLGPLRLRRRVGDDRPRRDGDAEVVELADLRPRDRSAVHEPLLTVARSRGRRRRAVPRRSGSRGSWSTRRCRR